MTRPAAAYVPPDTARIDRFETVIREHRFVGTAGATDLAVLEVLVALARRRARGVRFAASVDEIAAEAGVHRVTARRSLRRLCGTGLLLRLAEPTTVLATEWALVVPGGTEQDPGGRPGVREAPLGEDWARWGAVGKSAARVWRELAADRPRSGAEVARVLQVSRNVVHKHLKRLHALGAVDRVPGGWVRRDVDGVAKLYGVDGARERERRAVRERRAERRAVLGHAVGAELSR